MFSVSSIVSSSTGHCKTELELNVQKTRNKYVHPGGPAGAAGQSKHQSIFGLGGCFAGSPFIPFRPGWPSSPFRPGSPVSPGSPGIPYAQLQQGL